MAGQRQALNALKARAPALDTQIVRMVGQFHQQLDALPVSQSGQWVLDTIKEYVTRPGKRLRGLLAAELYDQTTGQVASLAGLQLGAAIELIHNYMLVVDDVMDKSPLRRGLPTVQELYKKQHPADSEEEANLMAVTVGMLQQHIASWGLSGAEQTAGAAPGAASQVVHHYIFVTGLGQVDDLVAAPTTSADEVLAMYRKKSSYYTFVSPLMAALALAGHPVEPVRPAVERFGLPAGVAFQLRDDWLGVFGDTSQSGKANLDDIREGKRTFLVQAAMAAADATQRQRLGQAIGNPQADRADLVAVRDIMRATGAVRRNDQMMQAAADQAIQAARASQVWGQAFADLLTEVVDYSIERTV